MIGLKGESGWNRRFRPLIHREWIARRRSISESYRQPADRQRTLQTDAGTLSLVSSTTDNTASSHSGTVLPSSWINASTATSQPIFCVICVICGYTQCTLSYQKSVAKRNKMKSFKKNRENIPFDKKPQKRLIFAKGFGSKKNPLRRFLEK